MKIIFKKTFFTHLLALSILTSTNVFAYDYLNEDFSRRSLIMKMLNGETKINQEQKDILKDRKLEFSIACLNEQIKNNNIENVKILLDFKIDVNKQYQTTYPIYLAAKVNNFEILKLLYSYGAKLDRGFYSELYEAIRNKNEQMAFFLIENNANVNYIDAITGHTPLYFAVKNNMTDVAKELIKKGAKIDKNTYILIKRKKLDSIMNND